ncbi:hypothetical protein SUNI508_11455 [Seiridium unicorne]|uniref:Uncharacterized protein n=1 Tax=Seiridium unicorne TaxID=138068 RepID=A0ABR2UH97_9PEZI
MDSTQVQTRLSRQTLSQLPYKSNITSYLQHDQNFERRAQGLPTRPVNPSKAIRDFERQWNSNSSRGTSGM